MLRAVVRELAHKAKKAVDNLQGADPLIVRSSIVEVEQATDGRKWQLR